MTERGPYPRSRGQQTDRATVVGARSAQNRPVRRGASASAECPRAGLRTKFAVAEWSLCPTRHGMFPRQRVPPPFAFRMRRQKPLAEGSRRRIGQTTYLLVGQGGRWLVSCATGTPGGRQPSGATLACYPFRCAHTPRANRHHQGGVSRPRPHPSVETSRSRRPCRMGGGWRHIRSPVRLTRWRSITAHWLSSPSAATRAGAPCGGTRASCPLAGTVSPCWLVTIARPTADSRFMDVGCGPPAVAWRSSVRGGDNLANRRAVDLDFARATVG